MTPSSPTVRQHHPRTLKSLKNLRTIASLIVGLLAVSSFAVAQESRQDGTNNSFPATQSQDSNNNTDTDRTEDLTDIFRHHHDHRRGPEPSPTPAPTATPQPTATPMATPTPTPTPVPTSAPSTSARLSVNGVTLQTNTGTRYIIKGVNVEYYRDNGCSFITTTATSEASQIIAKLKSLGINTVRLDYSASWLGQGSNITTYLNFMKELASNGIYIMPSDHSFTGQTLTNYQTVSFPLFKAIIQGASSMGIEDYLIMNPYNEPYGQNASQSTWQNWITANETTLQYLRTTLGFKGVVVLDSKDWAANFDATSFQTVIKYDASLLGGSQGNVIISNHWYPNISYSQTVEPTFTSAKTIPLVIGEIGQINVGTTGIDDSYVTTLFSGLVSTGIPAGHNGAFPWIWSWCDQNTMTDSDELTLNSYGQLVVTDFYSKNLAR